MPCATWALVAPSQRVLSKSNDNEYTSTKYYTKNQQISKLTLQLVLCSSVPVPRMHAALRTSLGGVPGNVARRRGCTNTAMSALPLMLTI